MNDELYRRKKVVSVEGFAVYLPTIEDLIRIKKVRSSPKDVEDIKYLQVLAERDAR